MIKFLDFSNLKIELQILIRAGEAALDSENNSQLEELVVDKIINWEKVYHLACVHQIRPLLLKGLLGLKKTIIPIDILQKLKKDCFHITARSLSNTSEMLRLIELFEQNNIVVVPYKGPYLTNKYYGDFGLRESGDIDLFIKEEDISAIKNLLLSNNYHLIFQLTDKQEKWNRKIDYDYSFYKNDNNNNKLFHLEMHYRTTPSYYLIDMNLESFPNVIVKNNFLTKPIKTLSEEAHLLFIFTHHGIKENWSKLKYLFDLKVIIEKSNLDWDLILNQTQKFKITPTLLAGINICNVIFKDFNHYPNIAPNQTITNLTARFLYKINFYNGAISDMYLHWNTLYHRSIYDNRLIMIINHLKPLITPNKTDFLSVRTQFLPIGFYYFIRPFRMISVLIRTIKNKRSKNQ